MRTSSRFCMTGSEKKPKVLIIGTRQVDFKREITYGGGDYEQQYFKSSYKILSK